MLCTTFDKAPAIQLRQNVYLLKTICIHKYSYETQIYRQIKKKAKQKIHFLISKPKQRGKYIYTVMEAFFVSSLIPVFLYIICLCMRVRTSLLCLTTMFTRYSCYLQQSSAFSLCDFCTQFYLLCRVLFCLIFVFTALF